MTQIAPISLQQSFWNEWNASVREKAIDDVSIRHENVVCGWLTSLGGKDLDIIEVGCGAGWLCPQLTRFARVTAIDLADRVLARAKHRTPEVTFVPGDFMNLEIGTNAFDVAVTLEVLSHVADQSGFIAHLRSGGYLMMATQNRFVLERFNRIPPPAPGQLRRWLDRRELQDLLEEQFDVLELFSVAPRANHGIMKLINSRQLNRPIRALVGDRIDRLKEAMGLGWSLMALARRLEGSKASIRLTRETWPSPIRNRRVPSRTRGRAIREAA
jgi:2-polyprenyl-3-methyl-5-hydroxy-6-metoxy-1,4-benzoquinol methylase